MDYDRLAVVYSCTQLAFLKYELGWILTRDPVVNQSVVSGDHTFTGCLQSICIGCNAGNGEKLSSSQVQLGQVTSLDVA